MTVFLITIYAVVIVAAAWTGLRHPHWFPCLLVLLLPTGNLSFEAGVTWTPWKAALVVFWLTWPCWSVLHQRRVVVPKELCLLLSITTVLTLIMMAFDTAPSFQGYQGALRSPQLRPVAQLLSLFLRASCVVVVASYVNTAPAARRLFSAMVAATTLVSVYGIYQVIAVRPGWPALAIYRSVAEARGGFGVFTIGGIDIVRLSSFVGEPKDAAKFLLPSIAVIVFARLAGERLLASRFASYPVLLLHVLAFALTFATSSIYAAALAFPFVALVIGRFFKQWSTRGLLTMTALSVMFLLGIALAAEQPSFLRSALESRTIDRVGQVDDPDRAAWQFLKDNPRYLVSGVGLGNGSFYVRRYFNPDEQYLLTVAPNSSYLAFLLESGGIGLGALLWYLFATLAKGTRCALRTTDPTFKVVLAASLAVALVLAINSGFSSTEATGQLWVLCGVLFGLSARSPAPRSIPVNRNLASYARSVDAVPVGLRIRTTLSPSFACTRKR